MDAKMDVLYADEKLTCQGEIELSESVELPLPHWCFPDGSQFCCSDPTHQKYDIA